jgi:signal peptidase I
LVEAIRARRRDEVQSLSQRLNEYCGSALNEPAQGFVAENVEMLWVALVVVLGIRAFIAQPFQIPTGSMQPTLNGITAVATKGDPKPSWTDHLSSWFTGTRYVHAVADHTGYLDDRNPISEHRFLIFMPYCKLHFRDGHSMRINAPMRQLLDELQLAAHIHSENTEAGNDTPDRRVVYGLRGGEYIRQGQVLASGVVRNGDHVLVDKFSYHFRQPVRGEVFVFTTKHISGIQVPVEQGAQYYIKRLTGMPGDLLEVDSPTLLINGQPAAEEGIRKVMAGTRDQPRDGYRGYGFAESVNGNISKIRLRPGDYFAMGDNSYNSSDSRVWGPVPERNLVGPALACYWPLTRHFGRIR